MLSAECLKLCVFIGAGESGSRGGGQDGEKGEGWGIASIGLFSIRIIRDVVVSDSDDDDGKQNIQTNNRDSDAEQKNFSLSQ